MKSKSAYTGYYPNLEPNIPYWLVPGAIPPFAGATMQASALGAELTVSGTALTARVYRTGSGLIKTDIYRSIPGLVSPGYVPIEGPLRDNEHHLTAFPSRLKAAPVITSMQWYPE